MGTANRYIAKRARVPSKTILPKKSDERVVADNCVIFFQIVISAAVTNIRGHGLDEVVLIPQGN